MALKDNNPTFSWVSWSDLLITYNDITYQIKNSSTNMKYVYWDVLNPYVLQCYNRTQKQSVGIYQLFINDNGISTQRSHEDLIISWDGNNSDLIASQIFGLHESNKETGNKFVAIETDINGIKQTVGNTQTEVGKLTENVSQIKQQADNIDLSVKSLTQEFSDNKEILELRENLNKSMIDFNSSLGIFKSEIYSYYKDNKIDLEEKIKINTQLDLIDSKKSEVLKYIDIVVLMMSEEGQTTQVNKLNSAKNKFIGSISNLRTYITTAISDGTVVPSEITLIVDFFAKVSVSTNEMKNVCDDCIFLGAGGTISTELARIGIKSDEILISVSSTNENILNNLTVEKSILQGNITDIKDAIEIFKKIFSDVSKDGVAASEEKEILLDKFNNISKEKKDIDDKYIELYNHQHISLPEKNNLRLHYNIFDSKYKELLNKINSVISDGYINDAEKNQVDALVNELASSLNVLHSILTKCMDNIELNIQKDELNKVKESVDKEINDVNNELNNMGNYLEGAFKDGILDEQEREALKIQLLAISSEKEDIVAQISSLENASELVQTSELTNLNTEKTKYLKAHLDLISEIDKIIGGGVRGNINR